MRKVKLLLAIVVSILVTIPVLALEENSSLRVVVTIRPIHSLVVSIMSGVNEPALLVPSGVSPHTYALRPSDARLLDSAQIVIIVDPSFEIFLIKPLSILAKRAEIVRISDIPGLKRRPLRVISGSWKLESDNSNNSIRRLDNSTQESSDHSDSSHQNHNKIMTDKIDPHLWLDPDNACHIISAVTAVLAKTDPNNAATYRRNASILDRELKTLDESLRLELTPVIQRPFLVFHDAYQYLEARYGLNSVGALTLTPEQQPSTRHLMLLKKYIKSAGVVCIFHEPQFPPKLVEIIAANTGARIGTLDPLGSDPLEEEKHRPGSQYISMMRANARSLKECLLHERNNNSRFDFISNS